MTGSGELSVGRMRPLGVLGRNFPQKRLVNEVLTGELWVPQNLQGNPPIETGVTEAPRRASQRQADQHTRVIQTPGGSQPTGPLLPHPQAALLSRWSHEAPGHILSVPT